MDSLFGFCSCFEAENSEEYAGGKEENANRTSILNDLIKCGHRWKDERRDIGGKGEFHEKAKDDFV